MAFFDFLHGPEHVVSSAAKGTVNFVRPFASDVANIAKAGAKDTYALNPVSLAVRGAQAEWAFLHNNTDAATKAVQPIRTTINDTVGGVQAFPRAAVSLASSVPGIRHDAVTSTNPVATALIGHSPVPSLESVYSQKKQTSGSPAQAAGETAFTTLADVLALYGGVKGAHEAVTKVGAAIKPVFADEGVPGKVPGPILDKLANSKSVGEVKALLQRGLPEEVAQKIAPAIANTKDPNIIQNIVDSAQPHLPNTAPNISDVSNPNVHAAGTSVTALPPGIISDIADPARVSQPPTTAPVDIREASVPKTETPVATEKLKVPTTSGGEVTKEVPKELHPDLQRAVDRATKPTEVGSVDVSRFSKVKKLAQTIRTNFSGERNAQIQGAATLGDTLNKFAPEEQHGIYWYREAGGDVGKLQGWLSNPKLEAYHPEIEQALNLSPEARAVSDALDQAYAKAGANAVEQGTLKGVLADYNNARIYQKPEVPSGVSGILKQTSASAKARVYPDVASAIENGHIPATTNAADAAAIHLSELARVNSTRNLLDGMEKAGLGQYVEPGKVPAGFSQVGEVNKGAKVFAAPTELANKLRAITEPDFLARVDGFRRLTAYQGLVKTVDLSFSLFHHITEAAQLLYQSKGGIDLLTHAKTILKSVNSPEFQDVENNFVKHGGITTKVSDIADIVRNLAGNEDKSFIGKFERAPGVKQVLGAADKSSSVLFDWGQRWIKTTDWQNKITSWAEKHPEATPEEFTKAAQGYAKEVNAAYGGLNWESIGVTKTGQKFLRFVLLAPDWTISNLQLGKFALGGGTEGAAARSHLFTAAVTATAGTQAMNYAITGHSSFQNPKGHEFEVQLAPNVYVSLYKGGIGDLLKLYSNVQDSGPAQGTARFAQGKLGPLTRTVVGLASGTEFTGQKINNPNDNFAEKAVNDLKFIATSAAPIPLGVSSTAKYVNDSIKTKQPVNPAVTASLASGVARYSKSKNGLTDIQNATISQLAKHGGSKEQQAAYQQYYLTAKKTAPDRTAAEKAITAALVNGDLAQAQQVANKYNAKYKASFNNWSKKYGQYSDKTIGKDYASGKINLTSASIKSRLKAIKNNPLYAK